MTFYNYTDPRDGCNYRVIKTKTGDFWMAEDLNLNLANSLKGINGRYYGGIHLPDLAPPGWKVPSIKDWRDLFKSYGKSTIELNDAGFNIIPTGLMEPYDSENGEIKGAHFNPNSIYYLTSDYIKDGLIWEICSIFVPEDISKFFPCNYKHHIRILFNGNNEILSVSESPKDKFVPVRCVAPGEPNGLQVLESPSVK